MPRANEQQSRVFYKGKVDDFVIFVDDAQALNNWRKDRTIPLAQVLNGWKIFVTHRYVTMQPFLPAVLLCGTEDLTNTKQSRRSGCS